MTSEIPDLIDEQNICYIKGKLMFDKSIKQACKSFLKEIKNSLKKFNLINFAKTNVIKKFSSRQKKPRSKSAKRA